MGTIAIAVQGRPIFSWDGDEAAIKKILEEFPRMAHRVGQKPDVFAQAAVFHLREGNLVSSEPVGQGAQMMAAIWYVLNLDTTNKEHPGKIADYAAMTDFGVDFDMQGSTGKKGETFKVDIKAFSKFDS